MMRSHFSGTAAIVEKFLTEDHWMHSFNKENGLFDFDIKLAGYYDVTQCVIFPGDEEIGIYVLCPIHGDRDDENMMTRINEFLSIANKDLATGSFELDRNSGSVIYVDSIDCRQELPDTEDVKNRVDYSAMALETFAAGFAAIIIGGCSAKEAYEKCQDAPAFVIRRFVEAMRRGEHFEP